MMETNAVPDHERVEKLAEVLTNCLSELDQLNAHVAAAHLDSALHALSRQFDLPVNISDPE